MLRHSSPSRVYRYLLAGAFALVAVKPARTSSQAQTFLVTLPHGASIELSFAAVPPLEDCQPGASDGDALLWNCARHRLRVTPASESGADVVRFQLTAARAESFQILEYGARVTVELQGDEAVWSYNRLSGRSIMETSLEEPLLYESSANRGIPFAELVDRRGRNRLAIGLLIQNRCVRTEGRLDRGDYSLSLRQMDASISDRLEDGFFVSRAADTWFHVARAYTDVVDRERRYVPLDIPNGAYDATYDSWYWTEDKIDEGLVWDLASRSRALGFGSYLIDAGWDAPAGEYSLWIDGATGNYEPPPGAFRDFTALVDRIRSRLGMRVMLWMQQYALGRRSAYYPEVGDALSSVVDSATGRIRQTAALCPRTPAARDHIASIVGRVLDEYRPDAFWFDWQEGVPADCAAEHAHDLPEFGPAYNSVQQAVLDSIQQRDPNVYAEMRWPFANLNNKPYAQLWQPVDSPGDFELMRLRALQMRPFAAGVVMGTDEMYWSPRVSDVEAARFMAAVVFSGVPYFGPNLLAEPEHRGAMLGAWLRFYQDNQADLTSGSFEPYGDRESPDQFIESPNAAFVYYGNRYRDVVALSKGSARIHVVNASYAPGIELRVSGIEAGTYVPTISDLYLKTRTTEAPVPLHGAAVLRYNVQMGCMLTLERR